MEFIENLFEARLEDTKEYLKDAKAGREAGEIWLNYAIDRIIRHHFERRMIKAKLKKRKKKKND